MGLERVADLRARFGDRRRLGGKGELERSIHVSAGVPTAAEPETVGLQRADARRRRRDTRVQPNAIRKDEIDQIESPCDRGDRRVGQALQVAWGELDLEPAPAAADV